MNTKKSSRRLCTPTILALALGLCTTLGGAVALAADEGFIPRLVNTSTIPANGDVNPYGVAFVPAGFPGGGSITAGDVLIANFNNSLNVQGTGTTIVQFSPVGAIATPNGASTFFTSNLPGLSTALGVLRGGFVLVGNVPTTDGAFDTIGAGALQILDRYGNLVQTWTSGTFLDGPWDLAVDDHGAFAHVFIANVLNGTVSRLDVQVGTHGLTLKRWTTIATSYTHVPNAAAVVLGPTGLAYVASTDTLYVAATADNAIFAVTQAAARTTAVVMGNTVFADPHLRGPLALRMAPNGNLLTANGDAVNGDVLHPSEIVEFTTEGRFIREYNVDPSQGGAFGIDTILEGSGWNYAVIDDVTNSLAVYRLHAR